MKIFTDTIHGLSVGIKTKIDAIQLITFLCSDGALVPQRQSNQTQIKSSDFELKLFRRCENFLFGIFEDISDDCSNIDGSEPPLTRKGFAACLFYFLSFQKPELSETILKTVNKTTIYYCQSVDWDQADKNVKSESSTTSDINIIAFIKDHLNDMHGNSDWIKLIMIEIKKIYDINQQKGTEDSKLEAIDNLYGSELPQESEEKHEEIENQDSCVTS